MEYRGTLPKDNFPSLDRCVNGDHRERTANIKTGHWPYNMFLDRVSVQPCYVKKSDVKRCCYWLPETNTQRRKSVRSSPVKPHSGKSRDIHAIRIRKLRLDIFRFRARNTTSSVRMKVRKFTSVYHFSSLSRDAIPYANSRFGVPYSRRSAQRVCFFGAGTRFFCRLLQQCYPYNEDQLWPSSKRSDYTLSISPRWGFETSNMHGNRLMLFPAEN